MCLYNYFSEDIANYRRHWICLCLMNSVAGFIEGLPERPIPLCSLLWQDYDVSSNRIIAKYGTMRAKLPLANYVLHFSICYVLNTPNKTHTTECLD